MSKWEQVLLDILDSQETVDQLQRFIYEALIKHDHEVFQPSIRKQ